MAQNEDHFDPSQLLRRMDQMVEIIMSIERRGAVLDPSIVRIARDSLQRAREEFDDGNFDLCNEFLMNTERVCSD
jgi:hypothetical protein